MAETNTLSNTAQAVVDDMKKKPVEKIILGLLPFTPVPFTKPDTLLAIGRIALYSTLAYVTYNKTKPFSYGLMGASCVCLMTSLMGGMWAKK